MPDGCYLHVNFMGSFLYRKSEALATNTNLSDNKLVEEKNGYVQDNGSALS